MALFVLSVHEVKVKCQLNIFSIGSRLKTKYKEQSLSCEKKVTRYFSSLMQLSKELQDSGWAFTDNWEKTHILTDDWEVYWEIRAE